MVVHHRHNQYTQDPKTLAIVFDLLPPKQNPSHRDLFSAAIPPSHNHYQH
jgi:hypothetical protein